MPPELPELPELPDEPEEVPDEPEEDFPELPEEVVPEDDVVPELDDEEEEDDVLPEVPDVPEDDVPSSPLLPPSLVPVDTPEHAASVREPATNVPRRNDPMTCIEPMPWKVRHGASNLPPPGGFLQAC